LIILCSYLIKINNTPVPDPAIYPFSFQLNRSTDNQYATSRCRSGCLNTLKYSSRGGNIEVSGVIENGSARIDIKDYVATTIEPALLSVF